MSSELKPVEPVNVLPVFRDERAALMDLLTTLDGKQWDTNTPCPGWSVHDLAAHLLGDDLGVLSRGRDEYLVHAFGKPGARRAWSDIVASLNELNERWVQATHHLSGRLITELLGYSGELVYEYFSRLDPRELGDVVSWAGADPAPHWLNIAREYTERWVHQAQIRQALRLSGLTKPRFVSPVIATFARALPRAYSAQEADEGAYVTISVHGESGGSWSLRRQSGGWE